MKSQKQKIHTPVTRTSKKRRGVTLLETVFVLIIAVAAITAGSYFMGEHTKQQTARSTADHLIELTEAYNKYINDNYESLSSSVSSYITIDINELTGVGSGNTEKYLPVDFKNKNIYGQEYVLSLRKLDGGILQGVIYSRNGDIIPIEQALRVSRLVGYSGGYTTKENPSIVVSNLDGYYVDLTQFGGGDAAGGKLVSSIFLSENAVVFEDYLYRNKIEGHPELNRMNTHLKMGDGVNNWDINNINNLNVLVDVNVGNNTQVDGNVYVGGAAKVDRDMSIGRNATIRENMTVEGNTNVAGNMKVKGYVQGRAGVRSLKEGLVGDSCTGGEIGYLRSSNTTLFCRSGRWITADYAIGHANGFHNDGNAFYYTQYNIGSTENNSVWCTERNKDYLIGVMGGTYILYDSGADRGTLHPDCRVLGHARRSYTNQSKVQNADTAYTALSAGSVVTPTEIHTYRVTRIPYPDDDDD